MMPSVRQRVLSTPEARCCEALAGPADEGGHRVGCALQRHGKRGRRAERQRKGCQTTWAPTRGLEEG